MTNASVGKRALVVGDSRRGKTVACNTYQHKHRDQRSSGDTPIVPVMYLHAPTESGPRELFVGLLEYLQYRIRRGTIADLRDPCGIYEAARCQQCGLAFVQMKATLGS